jgi:hypothetical protein
VREGSFTPCDQRSIGRVDDADKAVPSRKWVTEI